MSAWLRLAIIAALLATAEPSWSHHSFANFDPAKTLTYRGTVKEVQWANPHVWLTISVIEGGAAVPYSFECGAIPVLKRAGWTRDVVKPGDAVTVVSHPYRDGRPGGSVDQLILSDGRRINAGDALPDALRIPGVQ